MSIHIPLNKEEICGEICRFLDCRIDEVRLRVDNEFNSLGWNVCEAVKEFKVTPHMYDIQMEQLYKESDAFVFETLVFWASEMRQKWIMSALKRIDRYVVKTDKRHENIEILMIGDGSGNDSILLANNNYSVTYFDVPGSKTYDFAVKRFASYGLSGDKICVVSDLKSIQEKSFDIILCFEVLEHLVDPFIMIASIYEKLKYDGIALVTESFKHVEDNLPTHLMMNTKYVGKTDQMFRQYGLYPTWKEKNRRPTEYIKKHKFSENAYLNHLAGMFVRIKDNYTMFR